MVERHWRGLAKLERATAYESHLRTETLPLLRSIEGFVGATPLRRAVPGGVEFLVVTRWNALAAIQRFAGPDTDGAVVPAKVQEMMHDFDRRARHYDVIDL